jgi:hypothetical protein
MDVLRASPISNTLIFASRFGYAVMSDEGKCSVRRNTSHSSTKKRQSTPRERFSFIPSATIQVLGNG